MAYSKNRKSVKMPRRRRFLFCCKRLGGDSGLEEERENRAQRPQIEYGGMMKMSVQ